MSRKKIVTGIACGVIVAAVGITAVLVHTYMGRTEAVLADNQCYIYAYVSKLEGNEMTYMEVEESVITAYLQEQETENEESADTGSSAEEAAAGGMPESGMPEGGTSEGGTSEGGVPEGGMPEGGTSEGGMPEGGMPEGGTAEDDTSERRSMQSGDMPSGDMENGTQSVTVLVPVGAAVHTSTDASTTFQRLASGDLLKLLVETNEDGEEVIVEIWMLS